MATGSQVNKGGIGPAMPFAAPTVFHTGGVGPVATTTGTDSTPVVTETYYAEVFVPVNHQSTGVQLLNGTAVAGNVTAILWDSNGKPVANSASTAQSGTAAYQKFAWSAVQQLKGPARYVVGFQFNNVAARYRSHAIGAFIGDKKTGEVFGTITSITAETSFATPAFVGTAPIAALY